MKCPYNDCPFEGDRAAVQDHVLYVTTGWCDEEHEQHNLRERRDV